MSEKNIEKIDYYSIIKTQQKSLDKDIIISKLNSKLKQLTTEITRLSKENSDLKIKYSLNYDVQLRLRSAEETIKDLREQNLNLMLAHKNKESELGNNINQILTEKKIEKLKSDKNETLYMQKMLMANQIEMENKIYKEELEQLKQQIKINEGNAKNKINQLEIQNLIKYTSLKKRILNNLNETKYKLSNLNLQFMDNNNRTTNLQNYQLLMELEAQRQENEQLIKENENLNKQLLEIKGDLDIHQKVEFQLAEKIKRFKLKNNSDNISNKLAMFSSSSVDHKNNINNIKNSTTDNMNLIYKKLKKIKALNESEKIKNIMKRNKKGITSYKKMNKTQIDYNFIQTRNLYKEPRDIRDLSELSVNSKILSDRNNKDLNIINLIPDDDFLLKFKNVSNEQKYINLFNYLEKCLENFYADAKSEMKRKYLIKIDMDNLKKLKFNEFSKKEQYILLIILMNHILPLIYVYFNTNSKNDINENNLFKTDLNLNYKILNKIYGNTSNIIRRSFVGRDNKLTVELCMNKFAESVKKNNLSDIFLEKKI